MVGFPVWILGSMRPGPAAKPLFCMMIRWGIIPSQYLGIMCCIIPYHHYRMV